MTPGLAPLGTRKLPATLDEFLLLLGPRRPPPRPIVQEAREEEEAVPGDSMERFSDKEWPRQWYLNRCRTAHTKLELQTKVLEDYAKFYHHRESPY